MESSGEEWRGEGGEEEERRRRRRRRRRGVERRERGRREEEEESSGGEKGDGVKKGRTERKRGKQAHYCRRFKGQVEAGQPPPTYLWIGLI